MNTTIQTLKNMEEPKRLHACKQIVNYFEQKESGLNPIFVGGLAFIGTPEPELLDVAKVMINEITDNNQITYSTIWKQ